MGFGARLLTTLSALVAVCACTSDADDREPPDPTVTPMDSVELETLARDVGLECEDGVYFGHPVHRSLDGERIIVSTGDLGDESVRRAACGAGGISDDLYVVFGEGFTMIPEQRSTAEQIAAATGVTAQRYCP